MSENLVKIERKDHFYILTINRPHALNALNKDVFNELEDFFTKYLGDYSVKGVIITGEGQKAFVAGADIKEFSALDAEEGSKLSKRGQDIFFMIERFHAPVVAAVNGFALGGGLELALSCDFIYASEKAKLGLPEVTLGLIPGFGGTYRLARVVGMNKAKEMIFSGNLIGAAEALQIGLVNKVVAAEQLMIEAKNLAVIIASRGPMAVAAAKKSIGEIATLAVNEAMTVEAQ